MDDLRSADRVVVLGPDGRISSQGSYAQLAGSLPSTVVTQKSTEEGSDSDATGASSMTAPSQPGPRPNAKQPAQPTPSSSAKDKARSTGDLKCYAAYGRSMGWTRACIFLLFAVAFAFTSKFSRMCLLGWSLLSHDWYQCRRMDHRSLLTLFFSPRNLAAVVYRRRHNEPRIVYWHLLCFCTECSCCQFGFILVCL